MKSVNDLYRFLENLSELCWGVHFMLSKDETPNDKTLLTKLTMDLINFYAMLSDLEISFVCRCKHIGFTENQGNGVCDAVESLKQGDISALLAISDIGNSIPNIESVAGNMIDNLVELPNYVLAYIDEILLAATDKGSQNIFKKIVDKSGFMDLFIDKTLTLEQPYFEALENVLTDENRNLLSLPVMCHSIIGRCAMILTYRLNQTCNDFGFQIKRVQPHGSIQLIKHSNEGVPKYPNSQFSALEWGTIFYYVDSAKLTPGAKTLKGRAEKFMGKHGISTSYNSLVNKYHESNRRLNRKSDYPIEKLESILPFLEQNYSQVVDIVKNDIKYIKDNQIDY